MPRFSILIATFAAALSIEAQVNADVIIDSFDTAQSISIGFGEAAQTKVSTASTAGLDIAGLERDATLTKVGGAATSVQLNIDPGGSSISIYTESGTDGSFSFTYDGSDGDASALDHTGLSSLVLDDGTNDSIVFEGINNTSGSTDITGRVTVYTDATNFSTRSFLIVNGFTGNGILSFASFTSSGGTGADFADVGAIVIDFDLNSSNNSDFNFDGITARKGVPGPSEGPLPTPEPASIALFSIGAFALVGFCMIRRRKERLAGMVA